MTVILTLTFEGGNSTEDNQKYILSTTFSQFLWLGNTGIWIALFIGAKHGAIKFQWWAYLIASLLHFFGTFVLCLIVGNTGLVIAPAP